jgi:ParB family chromosome partitioning protein
MPLFKKEDRRQVLELSVHSIRPNPNQPRKNFSQAELDELAQSIAQLGVIQPLSVRRVRNGWELIAGERRLRAAKLAGLSTVPCVEITADNATSSLMALVENIQRKDLDFLDEAQALRRLIDTYHLSQEEAAAKVGKSQSAVANKLRLLKLPEDVLDSLRSAGCSERHARALLRLDSPELQRKAAQYVVAHELTVARTEDYVARLLTKPPKKRVKPIYRTKDVRLFLNTIQKGLSIMNSAGVDASCGRQETDQEILLTIHIPK